MKLVDKCLIIENSEIRENIFRMKILSPQMCAEARAGQFLHIKCGGSKHALLRRPISLSYRLEGEGIMVIVYRVEGQGTQFLSGQKPGAELDVMGPLGRGFAVDPEYGRVVLAGGGMGIAPLAELARVYGSKCTALLGYRNEPFLTREIGDEAGKLLIATEDGSEGHKGFVTDLLSRELSEQAVDLVYCCGPRPMMKRALDICRSHGVRCQLSLEERMGCGIGACLVCSCATRDRDGNPGYSRVCVDGPVFWDDEVMLDG